MAIYYQKLNSDDVTNLIRNSRSNSTSSRSSNPVVIYYQSQKTPSTSDETVTTTTPTLEEYTKNQSSLKNVNSYFGNNNNNNTNNNNRDNAEKETDEILDDKIPPLIKIQPKDQVTVGEIFSPTNFFLIKICSNQYEYDNMEKIMEVFYGDEEIVKKYRWTDDRTNTIEKNQFGVAYWQNIWRRVQIVHSNEQFTCCYLIDYGQMIIDQIETKNIYRLDSRFAKLPPKSFKARLAWISKEIWSKTEIDFFKSLVDGKVLGVTIINDDEKKYLGIDCYYDCVLYLTKNINDTIYHFIQQSF